ncbi:MAG: sulfite exporter TauE/SafE family protein [Thiotrichaceae bacterium]
MTSSELTVLSAFLVGLFGSVHCVGMCGGIVGSLTMGLSETVRQSWVRLVPYLLMYNLGRILSYMLVGLLAGFLGQQLAHLLPLDNPRMVAMWVSSIFMIILGLYIGGWWRILTMLEKVGSQLWKYIEPWGRRFLPVKTPIHALGLGIIWGWLPCGLVYSVVAFAVTTGDALQGSTLMLAFGIGTLPMMLTLGATANWLVRITRHSVVQQIIGALLIVFGLFIVFGPIIKWRIHIMDIVPIW